MTLELTRGTTRAFDLDVDQKASGRLVIIDLHATAVVIQVPRRHAEPTGPDGPITLEPPDAGQDEEPTWEDAEWQ